MGTSTQTEGGTGMNAFEAFLVGGVVGAAVGIAIYHYGLSTLHTKLDELIAYVKAKAPQ